MSTPVPTLSPLQAKWLEALRSGIYAQAYETLRDGDTFCCLGVLCDVHDAAAWEPGGSWRADDGEGDVSYYETEPPDALANEVDLDHSDIERLIALNDTVRAPFAVIADKLERRWLTGELLPHPDGDATEEA